MRVLERVPLAPWTTLRVGGAASQVAEVDCEGDIADAVGLAEDRGGDLVVLGGGSNVVVGDDGFPGVVLRVEIRGIDVVRQGDRVLVDAGAGEEWDSLVERAVGEGWCGLESLSGIPGRVGATPIQNVGAYGCDVGQTITSVRVFDRELGTFADLPSKACGFGYRTSLFKRTSRFIVTRVRFTLGTSVCAGVRYPELARALSVAPDGMAPLAAVRGAVIGLRRAKGMLLDPSDPDTVSVGSFFVNPVVDSSMLADMATWTRESPPSFALAGGLHKLAAAWLVEHAGFAKGWRKGRAGLSRKHSLALVNCGGATTAELVSTAREIRDGVLATFGVELLPEPVFIGCSWSGPPEPRPAL